ncbi:MAG: retropepsin-like aspartic protease [Cyanobacteria bacterium P01_F01_bin.56]
MARSLRWLMGVGSCCILSSCTLLPGSETTTPSANEATTAETADSAPAADTTAPAPAAETVSAAPPTPAAETPSQSQTNYFSEAITRAESAVSIGQSAQSPDDWQLAAGRWQQAMQYMQQVPTDDPNHATAQQKVQEYSQNLAMAEKRAAGEVVTQAPPAAPDRPPGLITSIPIVDSRGGIPVVPVTLEGDRSTQEFPMLFDTGASGTLITPAMADAVGVIITGSAMVTVADGRRVEIPIGYVNSLRVGNLVVSNLWVGIGGDVALLGQDVYGEYGISIGSNQINLYE